MKYLPLLNKIIFGDTYHFRTMVHEITLLWIKWSTSLITPLESIIQQSSISWLAVGTISYANNKQFTSIESAGI